MGQNDQFWTQIRTWWQNGERPVASPPSETTGVPSTMLVEGILVVLEDGDAKCRFLFCHQVRNFVQNWSFDTLGKMGLVFVIDEWVFVARKTSFGSKVEWTRQYFGRTENAIWARDTCGTRLCGSISRCSVVRNAIWSSSDDPDHPWVKCSFAAFFRGPGVYGGHACFKYFKYLIWFGLNFQIKSNHFWNSSNQIIQF